MTDLATIRAAASSPAFTPEGERLKSMMRALLALLPSDAAPAGEAPYEPSREEIVAFWESYNQLARYKPGVGQLADLDLDCAAHALKAARERR